MRDGDMGLKWAVIRYHRRNCAVTVLHRVEVFNRNSETITEITWALSVAVRRNGYAVKQAQILYQILGICNLFQSSLQPVRTEETAKMSFFRIRTTTWHERYLLMATWKHVLMINATFFDNPTMSDFLVLCKIIPWCLSRPSARTPTAFYPNSQYCPLDPSCKLT